MRYEEILGREFECACGRRHEVPVRRIVCSEDALGAAAVPLPGQYTTKHKPMPAFSLSHP